MASLKKNTKATKDVKNVKAASTPTSKKGAEKTKGKTQSAPANAKSPSKKETNVVEIKKTTKTASKPEAKKAETKVKPSANAKSSTKNAKSDKKADKKKTMSQKSGKSTSRSLDKKEADKLVKIANDIVKNSLTIRQASEKHDIPRATLHKRIHNHLPTLDAKLYDKLVAALEGRNRNAKSA